ncbi:MAG: hypothetical protein NTZ25_05605 [Candidatus Peregrinibacteria bacterium]|nr:hypothetical protein [Candidatus Peregrinibacteria bacterium]
MNPNITFDTLALLLVAYPDLTKLLNTSGVIVVYTDDSFIIVPDAFRGKTRVPSAGAIFLRYVTTSPTKNGAGYVGEPNERIAELVSNLKLQAADSWRFGAPSGEIVNLDGKVLTMDTCGSELVFDDERNPVVINTFQVGDEYEITITQA